MNVAVIALGKIGLPLAVQIASKGHRVHGVDINEHTVAQVNDGVEPFPGEAELDVKLKQVIDDGMLSATTDGVAAVAASEVVIVVVPLMVDEASVPDFGAMDAATATIAEGLQPGTLVSYETTLPVHTTRQRFGPMLADASGLALGEDFFLCHSPERVYSGRIFSDLRRYPKLVGGTDPASTQRSIEFYQAILDFDERDDLPRPNGVWDLGSAEAAELAKLMETTYRDVNIALANEFAIFSDRVGVDVYKVIEAANSQPFSHVHQPGIAVGGHCIPVYPRFYLSNHPDALIPAHSRDVNESMPAYAVARLADELGDLTGLKVAVLGLAYRGGVKETAFSGAIPTIDALRAQGAVPVLHDPLYDDEEIASFGVDAYHFGDTVDAAIVQANHEEYRSLGPDSMPGIRALVDGRAFVEPDAWTDVPRQVLGAPRGGLGAATGDR
ncbi:MAG TPA: nucleotide sugar dehydrogenase [Nitriliruptoraceae bacterium]|nr:nucleotide sugar dehydrogenase [Nitriliruptoraceae bacterium]